MARLYTNENFPQQVAEELRRLGHDVLTMKESGEAGRALDDVAVLAHARADRRILVTLNRRHFVRLHEQSPDHQGIVVCTFDPDFIRQAQRIHLRLQEQERLEGCLLRVNRPNP